MDCGLDKHGANHPGWWDGPDRYHNINRCEVSIIQRDAFFKVIESIAGGTGIDIGAGTLRFGNTLCIDLKNPCDILARGESLPFRDKSVNYVLSCHSLEHMPDTERTLKEWMRVLKVGGFLAVVMPDKDCFKHDPAVTKDGEVARHELTPLEILPILQKLQDAELCMFNTRNNNFDFDILIRKGTLIK